MWCYDVESEPRTKTRNDKYLATLRYKILDLDINIRYRCEILDTDIDIDIRC